MKLFTIAETDNGLVNWDNANPKDTREAYQWALKQKLAAEHQKEIFRQKLEPYIKHLEPSMDGNFAVPVVYKINTSSFNNRLYNGWYGIPTGTPNADKLYYAVKAYFEKYERAYNLYRKYSQLVTALKSAAENETFNEIKKTKPETYPSTSVPRRIVYNADGSYFNNPYWIREKVISRYAGSIGHFTNFFPQEIKTFVHLEQTLKRYGIDGFTTLYGCTTQNGKYKRNNFVAIGANGKVIWKHSDGEGNIVYVNGKKSSMTTLLAEPAPANIWKNDYQKQIIKLQKEILKPLIDKPAEEIKEIYANYKELGIPEPTEWENHPHVLKRLDFWPVSGKDRTPEIIQYEKERKNKSLTIKKQMDVISRKLYDIYDDFPGELFVRALPDENDEHFLERYYEETIIPSAVQENPDAYQMIKVQGAMFWEDMMSGDEYPDGPSEEFYVLKNSPRAKYIVNLINRYKQLQKLSWTSVNSIPTIFIEPSGEKTLVDRSKVTKI